LIFFDSSFLKNFLPTTTHQISSDFIHQSAYLLSSELIKDCKALPAVDCIAVPLGLVAGSLKKLPTQKAATKTGEIVA